jgi:alpha-glucosidase
MPSGENAWWRDAVIYQVYPRSFADSDGDGLGDIPGIVNRIDYLHNLGVDAVWVSPFYQSPLKDGGYDVTDYRMVDTRLGTVADLANLIDAAHQRDMKVFMDIVPNHTSDQHEWFQEVLHSEPGSPAWDRYVIKEGKGVNHELPPTNWESVFHGAAWSPLVLANGEKTKYWYLHIFDSSQPDLNWENSEVREEFLSILKFWFDLGIDGFRIDVAHGMIKDRNYPDIDYSEVKERELLGVPILNSPFWDQDGVHDIYREWRKLSDSYNPPRVFCGETWAPTPERLALYQRPDELHTSFNFDYLRAGFEAPKLKESIDSTLANHRKVGAPPTWVLSNHDIVRHATRLAPGQSDHPTTMPTPENAVRGLSRARAATLFTLGLPGSTYLYQGEELGLPEVLDLPPDARQDPIWIRSNGTDIGRDGCRVPIPWSGDIPSFGFGPGEQSWLPQPPEWASLSVQAQESDDTTLNFYRSALARRRIEPTTGDGDLIWRTADFTDRDDILVYTRPHPQLPLTCVLNTGEDNLTLPPELGVEILQASGPDVAIVDSGDGEHLVVGPETAIWIRA